ncbi:MAG: 50S ribosomal protein L10 [Pirellulaceae bacterium]|nr:50S ribosomal protein L10 [Planctomycetales bacterium]
MSKFVKNLITRDLGRRLDGVENALLVNVIGMGANETCALRKSLREQNIELLVVKNSLARRAVDGTPLAGAFDDVNGSAAIVWGASDIVSLAKVVTKLDADVQVKGFEARGGIMDGEPLTADRVKEISKWPSREEQLSIVAGQILSPGANLSAALLGPGKLLASQVKKKSEEE